MPNSSIWPIDRTLSGTPTPGQSGPRNDGNEGVLRISQRSCITGSSPSDCLVSCPGHSLQRGNLTPRQRCSLCILQPQPTGLNNLKLLLFKDKEAVLSILLYGCTTLTLTKCMEKRPDGNYTILKNCWRQNPTNSRCIATYHPSRKLSKLDEPDMRGTAGEVNMNS